MSRCDVPCLDEVLLCIPPGPSDKIVDVGSFDSPIEITNMIVIPPYQRVRLFITTSTAVSNPVIQNSQGTQEVFIYYVETTGSLELDSVSNLKLSGSFIPVTDSMLNLQWVPGPNKYTEVNRNEI